MSLLIFDQEPLIPMKIEQTIALASPNIETSIESFENYDDALRYCRDRRDVAFFIVSDNSSIHKAEDIFSSLSEVYEMATGWPAMGCLYFSNEACIDGYRALSRSSKLVEYIPRDLLLDKNHTAVMLERFWNIYIERLENSVFPEALQKVWISLAVESGLSIESQRFRSRITQLICNDLNVSWVETLALKWIHVFDAIARVYPFVLAANQHLTQVVTRILPDFSRSFDNSTRLLSLIVEEKSLVSRIANIISFLDISRISGRLNHEMHEIKAIVKPGSPALSRIVARHSDAIISFSRDDQNLRKSDITEFKGVG